MPELPEVETIARGLAHIVCGRRIVSVQVVTPSSIRHGDPQATLPGKIIQRVSRRAKLLQLELNDGRVLIFHLKMTGRVWAANTGTPKPKHVHLILELDAHEMILFEDQRRFGFCGIYTPTDLAAWDFYRNLGPEPLECSPEDLAKRLAGRRSGIKALLLNQTVLAGVGNIYADESLFAAKIHPATPAANLSTERLTHLCSQLQAILRQAIEAGGSTISDYRNAYGKSGLFQEKFAVYGKKGQPCPACSRPLQTQTVAGRTSTHCPHCQLGR